MSQAAVENATDIVDCAQVVQEWAHIRQLRVVRIAEPARHRDRIVRMEDIAGWRVVEDDGALNGPPKLRKVLDVDAFVVVAMLAEQAVTDSLVYIELIEDRVGVLRGNA